MAEAGRALRRAASLPRETVEKKDPAPSPHLIDLPLCFFVRSIRSCTSLSVRNGERSNEEESILKSKMSTFWCHFFQNMKEPCACACEHERARNLN